MSIQTSRGDVRHKNCTACHKTYGHGDAKSGARDKVSKPLDVNEDGVAGQKR